MIAITENSEAPPLLGAGAAALAAVAEVAGRALGFTALFCALCPGGVGGGGWFAGDKNEAKK